jgi:hypothetical protein
VISDHTFRAPRFAPDGDGMVDIGAFEVDAAFASVATNGVDET